MIEKLKVPRKNSKSPQAQPLQLPIYLVIIF